MRSVYNLFLCTLKFLDFCIPGRLQLPAVYNRHDKKSPPENGYAARRI